MLDRTSSCSPARRAPSRLALTVLGALGLVLASCTEKITEPPPPPDPPTAFAVPDSIQEVFDQMCGFQGCHGGAAPRLGLQLGDGALTSYRNIVNVPAESDEAYDLIAPGDSLNSYIVMKLRNDPRILGNPMPFGGYPMDPALVMRIAAWAAQGAPGVPVDTTATGPTAQTSP
jgi:hypothetical protein